MRLTSCLMRYNGKLFIGYMPKYPGKVTTGKHRWVPPVRLGHRVDFFYELSGTQSAMNVLSKPFISKDQETALLQFQGKKHPEHWDDFMWQKLLKSPKHRYAAHTLASLGRSANFEDEE